MTDVLVRAEARDGLGVEQEPDRPEHLGHGRYSLARAPGTTSPSTSAPCPASLQALKDWPPSASTSAAGLRVYGGWLAGVGLGRGRRGYSTGVPFQCCCFFISFILLFQSLFNFVFFPPFNLFFLSTLLPLFFLPGSPFSLFFLSIFFSYSSPFSEGIDFDQTELLSLSVSRQLHKCLTVCAPIQRKRSCFYLFCTSILSYEVSFNSEYLQPSFFYLFNVAILVSTNYIFKF